MRFSLNNPGSYNSANKIGAEFENVARYIVAAERGNKTVGELLRQIFDSDGEWSGPIEVRYDNARGLEYRVGSYTTDAEGWISVADPADLRGAAGTSVGEINTPMYYGRQALTGDGSQTTFTYFHKDTDDLFVYLNGVLQSTSEYTNDPVAGTVTMTTAPANGDDLTILRFRKDVVTGYRRSEITAASGQVIVAFPHEAEETVQVYRNGILQRPGGSYDYTTSADQDSITFTTTLSAGDLITAMTVENTAVTAIGGLMLEDEYAPDGSIPWNKLNVPDNAIAQSKVNGLTTLLQNVGQVYIGSTEPSTAVDGDLWVDTSKSPDSLKFKSGGTFFDTSPNVSVPQFGGSDANLYLKVNATGQFLEWAAVDLSALVPKTFIGAANGVAGLDGSGRVPLSQVPEIYSLRSYNLDVSSVSNQTYKVQRVFNQKVRIDSIAVKTGSGSCDVEISIDGSVVGDKVSAGTSFTTQNLSSSVVVDAASSLKTLEIKVTGNASASDLEVTLAASNITA